MIGELNNMESFLVMYKSMKVAYIETTTIHRYERSNTHAGELLAPQSGALIISAYRDFQSNPTHTHTHTQSTYSFRAFKPFYSDQKQCK